jgi:hypothetical protein
MPIRTNRGRAAVYRRLWGWPLRSPRHLVTTLVVFAVLITALGIVLPKALGRGTVAPQPADPFGSSPTSATFQSAVPVATTTSPLPTRLESPLSSPTPAAPAVEALGVAKAWATAWVDHPDGITNEQWREGLRPYTTEEYLSSSSLSTVDPGNIPASKVTGEPTPITSTSYTTSVVVEIPTDGPKLSITVVSTEAGWRVSQYGQAD